MDCNTEAGGAIISAEVVLETIRRAAAFVRSQPKQFTDYIHQKQSSEVTKEIKLVERELSAMQKRAGELDSHLTEKPLLLMRGVVSAPPPGPFLGQCNNVLFAFCPC